MHARHALLILALTGCTNVAEPVGVDPTEASGGEGKADGFGPVELPEPICDGAPDAGDAGSWRHRYRSRLVALGEPHHRGIDLITSAGAYAQPIRGEISYGFTDKALEDEEVDLFACRAGEWRFIGSAITDDEGMFELDLSGEERLPIGIRSLYASVVGDRSGAEFLALVAPEGTELVFSDVDGTLTSSENAYPESLVTGADVGANEGAAEALGALRDRRYYPVYMTARGRRFTEDTREWLAAQGFPRGPLRLAPSLVTLPGSATVAYKAGTLEDIAAEGLVPAIGIGNRASDAEAYAQAGLASDRIFIEATEYASEDQPLIDGGECVGFESYVDLLPAFESMPPAP